MKAKDILRKTMTCQDQISKLTQQLARLCMLFVAAVGLGLSDPPTTAASEQVALGQSCHEIDAWVEAHRNQLPATYAEISQFPINYRKRIFAQLPAKEQSRLWRTHMQRYLELHPNLTSAQVQVVQRALDLASPETFRLQLEEKHEALDAVKSAVIGAFGDEDAKLLMETLEPTDAAQPDAAVSSPRSLSCGCSTANPWCGDTGHCKKEYGNCTISATGCGSWWEYPCNGLCI